MRLQPLPTIKTFLRSVGSASHSRSYVEYRYGVYASNSAAHVSIRLNTGRIEIVRAFGGLRLPIRLLKYAMSLSDKPNRLARRKSCSCYLIPIFKLAAHSDDFFHLGKKPGINVCHLMNVVKRKSCIRWQQQRKKCDPTWVFAAVNE